MDRDAYYRPVGMKALAPWEVFSDTILKKRGGTGYLYTNGKDISLNSLLEFFIFHIKNVGGRVA